MVSPGYAAGYSGVSGYRPAGYPHPILSIAADRRALGEGIDSCTLLAIVPNALTRTLRHRMAVILDPKDYALWLDPAIQDADRVQAVLRPYPRRR